jgi:hypothetical protein
LKREEEVKEINYLGVVRQQLKMGWSWESKGKQGGNRDLIANDNV